MIHWTLLGETNSSGVTLPAYITNKGTAVIDDKNTSGTTDKDNASIADICTAGMIDKD